MAVRRGRREIRLASRPDVDGLRAVAVLAVVAFHYFPGTLPGGFVGVDIFFVISGFLISQIIMGGLEQGTFSFGGFYARRVRRIFPALLLVLAASLVFGWIALLTNEYEQLGGHAAASAAFVANFVFWNESGYFDNAALTKPLLHLWSLSSSDPLYSYVSAPAVDMALRAIEDTKSVETVVIAAAARALFGLANDTSIADLPASGNYLSALHGLDASVSRLVAAGKRVILLVDNPTLPHVEDCLGRKTSSALVNGLLAAPANPQCQITIPRHLELSRQYRDLLEAVRARHPSEVSLFDTVPILCDSEAGVCTAMRDGRLLYGLTDHISEYGSVLVGRALNARLRPAGAERAQ